MTEWWERGFFKEEVGNILYTRERWESAKNEVKFIEDVLELEKGDKVLDLCCGVGRHAIHLAKKGYDVVGIDLSAPYINKAKKKADEYEVDVEFIVGDMREIPFKGEFDGVINLFTSFGYFRNNEENQRVLQQVYKSLKSNGKFLLELMNRDFLIKNFQESNWSQINGSYILEERSFDIYHDIIYNRWIIIDEEGEEELSFSHHVYSASDLDKMLHKAGFAVHEYFGDLHGSPFIAESRRLCALGIKEG